MGRAADFEFWIAEIGFESSPFEGPEDGWTGRAASFEFWIADLKAVELRGRKGLDTAALDLEKTGCPYS